MPKKSTRKKSNKFVFRKHANIGTNDAVEDRNFLKECFVDTGELDILLDTNEPKSIILGRTGAGKTALIEILKQRGDRVVVLDPESLALTYLADNSALSFYSEAGVNMDLFYSMLWRHIFVVEIIKIFFDTTNNTKNEGFLRNLQLKIFKKKSSESARDYLLKWGQTFWKETDYQITEYTNKLEKDMNNAISAKGSITLPQLFTGGVSFDRSLAEKLTTEQKAEIVKHAQPVVNKVQIRQMAEVISLLEDELLDDRQKKCYIAIDRLDERWINDNLRYRLIRSLIEAIRFINNKLSTIKIIVAIREDLLSRVFRFTRDAGDQEEKYKSLYLSLKWTAKDLESVIDHRVDKLMRDQYTNAIVRAKDVLPTNVLKQPALNYIIERTLRTPRDIIMFFNECLQASAGKTKISQQAIFGAEAEYSQSRLKALGDEWSADYADLVSLVIAVLKKRKPEFQISDISSDDLRDKMLDFLSQPRNQATDTYQWIYKQIYDLQKPRELLYEIVKEFHKIGVLGVKLESYQEIYWSYMSKSITQAELTEDTKCYIHPAFYRVLGIRPSGK